MTNPKNIYILIKIVFFIKKKKKQKLYILSSDYKLDEKFENQEMTLTEPRGRSRMK